jgi:hypothetical protein
MLQFLGMGGTASVPERSSGMTSETLLKNMIISINPSYLPWAIMGGEAGKRLREGRKGRAVTGPIPIL